MEKKLLKYFSNFRLNDMLGFAAILRVKEEDNFEDFVAKIFYGILEEKDKKKRKELIKLAKQVSEYNLENPVEK